MAFSEALSEALVGAPAGPMVGRKNQGRLAHERKMHPGLCFLSFVVVTAPFWSMAFGPWFDFECQCFHVVTHWHALWMGSLSQTQDDRAARGAGLLGDLMMIVLREMGMTQIERGLMLRLRATAHDQKPFTAVVVAPDGMVVRHGPAAVLSTLAWIGNVWTAGVTHVQASRVEGGAA